MSYNVDELFEFRKKVNNEYALAEYLKKDDPTITELEIPEKYNGLPVVEIGHSAFVNSCQLQKVMMPEGVQRIGADAFAGCTNLRSVSLPASLKAIGSGSFNFCAALNEVEFKSYPKFGGAVFRFNTKLPAEITLMGWVRSRDISRPLDNTLLREEIKLANDVLTYTPWFCRTDVFSLAAENDCFREIDEELLDELLEYSLKCNKPELTAYFLNLKKRKFGFKNGGNFDL